MQKGTSKLTHCPKALSYFSLRYALRQCYVDKECWCVDPYNGTLVEDSLGPAHSVTCRCTYTV